jgi:hypothetical protein
VTFAATTAPVVDFTAPQLVSTGGYLLGTMSNESDAGTFKVLGNAVMGTSAGFPSGGVPSNAVTNNVYAAEFAGLRAYVLFYSGATAPTFDGTTKLLTSVSNAFVGIFKSTEFYSPTLSNLGTSNQTLTVTNFNTAINPTTFGAGTWDYEDAAVTSGASSYTGVASGTARTGTVFDLAAVPEPSTAALGLLAGLGLMVRRRRD